MAAVLGDIDTDAQPPMTVPLRHFTVGFVFLLVATALGLLNALGLVEGMTRAAYRHLLLVGWVCLTIMGAMTQFVPVWSGVSLYSRRLAVAQLWLVAGGVSGLVAAFLTSDPSWFVPAGVLLLSGIWTFVYNLGRTLWQVPEFDVTEQHFALALVWFALLAPLGLTLAAGLSGLTVPLDRTTLLTAHVTVAVFGAVVTTVVGALYQLATMFTQTELGRFDRVLQQFERVAYPLGVALLAGGRLLASPLLGRLGGVLVATGLLSVSIVLGRRLVETQVEWTPMLSRYGVLAVAMAAWSLSALPAWLVDPLTQTAVFGGSWSATVLLVGVVGFVVLGTLYHVVPFIVWVHRYSDLLGLEPVPMIDDLYDSRLARLDFALFVGGFCLLVLADVVDPQVASPGAAFLFAGAVCFVANMLLVLHRHSPHSLVRVVIGGSPGSSP